MPSEKLQKILAQVGLGSRRAMEVIIAEGRVLVNDQVAKLGDRIQPTDRVVVDKKPIRNIRNFFAAPEPQVIIYHKPTGQVCTRKDEEGRSTVFEYLPKPESGRWIMIGRLDINTSGLLLFTNHGELANRLMHPKYAVEREYAVRILGNVDEEMLQRLKTGVMLEDGMAKFDAIQFAGGEGANSWFHVILHEGRNKEVRRLWESQGVAVSRLIRVRYGQIHLPGYLRTKKWQALDKKDIQSLLKKVGLS